jgi:hypothetical protein
MKNFNPFSKNWKICKQLFLYRDFSISDNRFPLTPNEDGTLEKVCVYELTQLNLFESIYRWLKSESCYIRHKDNLKDHIPFDEVLEEEIENADKLANKIFVDRLVNSISNANRQKRLS